MAAESRREFHKLPWWSGGTISHGEEMYEHKGLVPSLEYFMQKAEENLEFILKPRMTVKPIVRRGRKIQITSPAPIVPEESSHAESSEAPSTAQHPAVIPDISNLCTLYSVPGTTLETPRTTPEPPIKIKPTARKSTGHTRKKKYNKKVEKCKELPIDISKGPELELKLIDLQNFTCMEDYLRPMLEATLKKVRKSKKKGFERKDSTDSGHVTDEEKLHEEGEEASPNKNSSSRETSIHKNTNEVPPLKRVAPPSTYKMKKKKIDELWKGSKSEKKPTRRASNYNPPKRPNTGATNVKTTPKVHGPQRELPSRSKRKMDANNPAKQKYRRPSIPVSIPLDRQFKALQQLQRPGTSSSYYLAENNNNNNNNNTIVNTIITPNDAVPTADFDVGQLMLSPLGCKRHKDPPPLKHFSPYEGDKHICIPCNKSFKTEQELASHRLANHVTFNY